jgi:hypothetical protein
MSLVTRQYGPDAKGSKLTNLDMDNNLYYLQSLGVSGMTFSANTLTLTNPTGGIIANALIDINADSRWFIPSGSTVEIGSYSQSFVYGDLYVLGELILNDNSQLIILNGNLILSGGTISVSGSGQTVLVGLPEYNTFVTGATLNQSTEDVTFTGNFGFNTFTLDLSPLKFTGGTINGDLIITNNTNDGKIGINVPNPTNALHISASTDPVKIESLTANTSDNNVLSIDDAGVVHKYPISGLSKSILSINSQTSNYILLPSDQNKLIEMSASTNIDVTVPAYSAVSYEIGSQILLVRGGSGEVSVVADSGVTIKSVNNYLSLNNQYSPATLVKIDTNTWYLFGDLKT